MSEIISVRQISVWLSKTQGFFFFFSSFPFSQNVKIPENIYRGIRNLLDSYHVPELIKVCEKC